MEILFWVGLHWIFCVVGTSNSVCVCVFLFLCDLEPRGGFSSPFLLEIVLLLVKRKWLRHWVFPIQGGALVICRQVVLRPLANCFGILRELSNCLCLTEFLCFAQILWVKHMNLLGLVD
uniref:Uncharacterized protein n=1 Tax=Rhizophora mucronata TaxID=61149 RepID=A0A2P2NVS5_RHIMU